jgi:hypothetical protein
LAPRKQQCAAGDGKTETRAFQHGTRAGEPKLV